MNFYSKIVNPMSHEHCSGRAILIFLLMALFLCFEMALQVSPGVMTEDLTSALNLTSFSLGIMSGVYFITYSVMQIPSGLMYDRLNIVKVVSIAIFLCSIGAGLFGLAHSFIEAALARLLMGFGSAFAFISVLTAAARYFPASYFAMLAGVAQLLAAVGAIGGALPIAWLNQQFGWRASFVGFMIFGLLLILAIIFTFRNMDTNAKTPPENEKVKHSLREILKNPQTWIIGFYAFFNWAPITAFASLWGVPYLMAKYDYSLTKAASLISLIWLGVGISSPLIGALSDRLKRRKPVLILTALSGAFAIGIIIYAPVLSILSLSILLFIAGLGSSGQVLSFAVVKDYTEHKRSSAAIGFNNMAVVASGVVMQPLIGKLIQLQGAPTAGLYPLNSFTHSLWLLPLCHVLCVILALVFIRETYPR
jgi:MFS family permease